MMEKEKSWRICQLYEKNEKPNGNLKPRYNTTTNATMNWSQRTFVFFPLAVRTRIISIVPMTHKPTITLTIYKNGNEDMLCKIHAPVAMIKM